MDTTTKIELQDILDLLPKRVSLSEIDYQDTLEDHEAELQAAIDSQSWEPLDDLTNEWFWENEDASIDYYKKDLIDDLQRVYDLDEDEAQELIDSHEDEIRDVLYERNDSTPLDDLLRNTSNPVAFYDTGLFIDTESWTWDRATLRYWRERVKRRLHIISKEHKFDRDIELMLEQASYGGRLVVYFRLDTSEFGKFLSLSQWRAIKFTDPMIAVIDTYNGSGDHTYLDGHSFAIRLSKDNITLDKTIRYSYTYSVCGMSSSWCDCTEYELTNTERYVHWGVHSTMSAERKREAQYNKTFKAGGCTSGDHDVRRHRDTYYDNNFPCGTHCPHCGEFWID